MNKPEEDIAAPQENCCGNCGHFKHESPDGIGLCETHYDWTHCSDRCKMHKSKDSTKHGKP